MAKPSTMHASISARNVRPYQLQKVGDAAVRELGMIGIHIDPSLVHQQVKALYTGDAALTSLGTTTAAVPTPIQFLQQWLPGFVNVITAARKIDEIVGISTFGSWEDEEIVQGIIEPVGQAVEYGDFQNIPLASWNANYERRTIVRGELGFQVGTLEEGRSAAMRVSTSDQKRQAAAIGLEMWRNSIGFYGYFNGRNRTFGFLNDPSLPDYTQVSGGTWATKNWQGIVNDLRLMIQTVRTQSMDTVDLSKAKATLVLPTDRVDYLTTVNDFGISVWNWLGQTYPNIRVISAPEMMLVNVNGAEQHVAYFFVEEVDASVDGSTDGGQTFTQLVQTKFQTLGVEKRAKGYVEDFTNATAGVLCKRPYLVSRWFGL
jgi:hypothetical protein